MYFTAENAARIDAVRARLHEWRAKGLVGDDAYFVLLAALLEGADRVANTAGVYAAYIKSWQPNARRALDLLVTAPARGARGSTAHQGDAAAVAAAIGRGGPALRGPAVQRAAVLGLLPRAGDHRAGVVRGAAGARGEDGAPGGRRAAQRLVQRRAKWCRRSTSCSRRRAPATCSSATTPTGISRRPRCAARSPRRRSTARVRRFTKAYKRYRADRDRANRTYRDDGLRESLYYARLR